METKIDILLVNSPIHDYSRYSKFKTSYSTPVGLLYLATVLEKALFSVEILDAEYRQLSPQEIASEITSKKPKFVGLNVFTVNHSIVDKVMELIDRDTLIILGGPHISGMSFEYFQKNLCRANYYIKYDGEKKLLDLLQNNPVTQIPNIYYRLDGILYQNFLEEEILNLDELPFPNRRLLSNEPYLKDGKWYLDISISRGCVFGCTFCAGSCRTNGTTYKKRSLESIKDELLYLISTYNIDGFEIVDDLPFYKTHDLEMFFGFVKSCKLNVEWDMNLPFLFLKTLKEEHFRLLRENNVKRISVGIEAGSYEIRKMSGKNIRYSELISLMNKLFDYEISVKGYFILGLPGETKEQIIETIDLAKEIFNVSIRHNEHYFRPRIFMYKPFPKTALWNRLLSDGYNESDLMRFHDFEVDVEYFNKHAWGSVTQLSQMSPTDIIEVINQFYIFINNKEIHGDTI
jgi:radical SAM superfamily enzyme YgiQ (UPF0313 family)